MPGGSPQTVTLVAATVSTITFTRDWNVVEVLNVDGAEAVYFSVDGSTPTVKGEGFHVLPKGTSSAEVGVSSEGGTVVKLISAGTPTVSVRGVS